MVSVEEKEYLLDAIVKHWEDIVTIKDLNFRYLAYNKSFLKSIGKDDKFSASGKSMFEILDYKIAETIEKNLKDVICTMKTKSYVFRVKNEYINKIIKQTCTPIIKNGKLEEILSVSTDITREENLRTKIIYNNSQLHKMLENLPFLAYMKNKNRELTISTKNSNVFVTSGFDKFSDNVRIDMNLAENEIKEEDNYVLENKKLLIKEKTARATDGKLQWYRIYKVPVLTDKDESDGLVTVAVNISKEKEEENQKELYLATLTHDLKNPLQAQISSLKMFYQGVFGALTDSQKEMVEMIIESSKYMRSMLYSVLKTCKENNGIILLEKTNFDIAKLMKMCIREVADLGTSKNIKIKFTSKIKNPEETFYADEIQIRRVIGNLLNNALNYAPKGSVINIEIKREQHKLFMIFENNGEPICADMAECIFDKYVCGKSLQNSNNTGLGLYFCKKIVEAHEGKIYLKSDKTKTVFILELPELNEASTFIREVIL